MARFKGRDLYRRIREESLKSGRPIRCSEDVQNTATMQEVRTKGLALDDDGQRIDGKTPQMKMDDFSIQELAASTIVNRSDGQPVGMAFIHEFFSNPIDFARLRESGAMDAVDYSMFMGITGQLLINSVLSGFTKEEFIFSKMAGTYKSMLVDGERLPGVSPPQDPDYDGNEDTLLRKPGQPFKYAGFGEEYIDLPATENRGLIIGIERLTIFADRTGLVVQQAGKVGELLGLRKEKRGLKTLIGLDSKTFKEKRLHDSAPVTIDPYQYEGAVSGTGQLKVTYATRKYPFYNDIASNPLTDYTAIKNADIAFCKTLDPNTGEPIVVGRPLLFTTKVAEMETNRVLQAYNVWKVSQAGMDTVGSLNTISRNPLGDITPTYSRQLRNQLIQEGCDGLGGNADPDKMWWYGDIAEAIKYIENWPIKVIQAPANSEVEFNQDIVVRFRADERGQWAWFNPRVLQRQNYQSQT